MQNPNSPTLRVGGQTLLDMTAAPYNNKFKIIEIRGDGFTAKISAKARTGTNVQGANSGDIAVNGVYSTLDVNMIEGQKSWLGDFEKVSIATTSGNVRCTIVPVDY